MKKITILTLMFISTLMLAQQAQFAKNAPVISNQLKNYQSEKNTNINIVWGEYFVDSIAAGVNGLPTNFSYTPNSPDIRDQWQWQGTSPNGYIGTRGWFEDHLITEEFTTDAHIVPANNPVFTLDFMNSFYWMIEQGDDSLEVLYSINNGSTWVRLWSNRDQSLVEASGVTWPYSSWVWQTARIVLPTSTIGENISFKFILRGSTANGIYLDNIILGELPDNDLAISDKTICSYDNTNNNYYSYNFNDQMPNDTTYHYVYVKNNGYNTQNGINLDFIIKKNGTIVYSQNINAFSQGGNSLLRFQKDTFIFYNIFEYEDNSEYTFHYTVNQTETDNDITNNDYELSTTTNYSRISRYNNINSSIGVGSYGGGGANDGIGIKVFLKNTVNSLSHLSVYIEEGTVVGDQIQVYFKNFGVGNEILGDIYTIQASDINNEVLLPLDFLPVLSPGTYNFGIQFQNTTTRIGAETIYYQGYQNYLYIGGNEYYINITPAISIMDVPCNDVSSSIDTIICSGDSYISPSGNYTWNASGTYNDTISISCGGDSIFTINLTVSDDITIIDQSQSQNICFNTNKTLFVDVTTIGATYQWYKDGNSIVGATNSTYEITNADFSDIADYVCIINNTCGVSPIASNTISIENILQINLDAGEDDYFCSGTSYQLDATMSPNYTGGFYTKTWTPTASLSSTNILDPVASPTETTEYIINISDDLNGCIEQDTIVLNKTEPYQNEQICMVTFDTISGNNLIIWEKTYDEQIALYKVWRKSGTSLFDYLVGEVPFNDMSELIDNDANPQTQVYHYKLQAIDNCGNASDLNNCVVHSTIHLQVGEYGGNYNLSWTEYYGFIYTTYHIYGRETGIGNFELLHDMPYGDNTWTDINSLVPSMEYRIAIDKLYPCVPSSGAKTTGGPYSQSISNVDDYSFVTTEIETLSGNVIEIYPNPAKNNVQLIINEQLIGSKIELVNVNGKIVLSEIANKMKQDLNVSNLERGVYFIKLISESEVYTQKLILK